METLTGYIGTYASKESNGIFRFHFDGERKKFDEPELAYPLRDTKYLSLYEGLLVSPCVKDTAGICRIDLDGKNLPYDLYMEDQAACYVVQDEAYVYTANYHEGCVMIYKKEAAKLMFHKRIDIKEHAGCHQVILYGPYLLVPCLLLDKIVILDRNQDYAICGELMFEAGSGPRHGVFSKDYKLFYLVSELSNEVFKYQVDGLKFTLLDKISIAKPGSGASAAIRLSSDEKYLYVSVRDADVIRVLDTSSLNVIQSVSSGGQHPRDIVLSPKEDYLLSVNRYSNNLVLYERDHESGLLKDILDEMSVIQGVSIVFTER